MTELEESKKRWEEYKNKAIEKYLEEFDKLSLNDKLSYIDNVTEMNYTPFIYTNYRSWLRILKLMIIKKIQINQLKDFYNKLGDKERKEFQTEPYKKIEDNEWDWRNNFEHHVDDVDKMLRPFYNLDTDESKLINEKEQHIIQCDNRKPNNDTSSFEAKVITNFIDRYSGKIIAELRESIDDFASLMKDNLSSSTKKKLFSLPPHARVYAFMEMYSTARFYDFDEQYLTSRYDGRKRQRDMKKQLENELENAAKNSKSYVKRKYPVIKPRI